MKHGDLTVFTKQTSPASTLLLLRVPFARTTVRVKLDDDNDDDTAIWQPYQQNANNDDENKTIVTLYLWGPS
jgi:hypothetical protein